MAFGTKDKGRAQEDALKAQAAAQAAKAEPAIVTAAAPTELEARRTKRVTDIDKWDMGELGPKDIRTLPGADTALALFRDAKTTRDAGRIGRGYGMLADGANPNFATALDKEMQLERDLAASGALEENVEGILEGNKAEMYGLSGLGNSRNQFIANLRSGASESAEDRSLQYLMRPKQPSFLKQLALSAVSGASQIGAAYMTGGASKAVGGCVTLDALVLTPDGAKPIGEVKQGDLVCTFDGDGRPGTATVINARHSPEKVMEIRTGGLSLRCTSSHVLQRFAGDMDEVSADQLRVGHSVLTLNQWGRPAKQRIESITALEQEEKVAILKLDNEHENFAFVTNGFLSLDDYRTEAAAAA